MGAKTGSIFFQKEPEQERSAKEKVKKECTYKLARGGGLEVTCIQLALQAKFAAAKSSSRSSSDSPKNKKKKRI